MNLMPVIYVAGKFRGEHAWEIENNVRRAEELSLEVLRLGASAICPHANTRFFHGVLPDQVFIDATLALLAKADGIIMLPGWESSVGSQGEYRWAQAHDLPIFHTLDDLGYWIDQRRAADRLRAVR